jgi:hypothetical protein
MAGDKPFTALGGAVNLDYFTGSAREELKALRHLMSYGNVAMEAATLRWLL